MTTWPLSCVSIVNQPEEGGRTKAFENVITGVSPSREEPPHPARLLPPIITAALQESS